MPGTFGDVLGGGERGQGVLALLVLPSRRVERGCSLNGSRGTTREKLGRVEKWVSECLFPATDNQTTSLK